MTDSSKKKVGSTRRGGWNALLPLLPIVLLACAEAPYDPPPPPPAGPTFSPAPRTLQSELYEPLEFEVTDPEGSLLLADWFANDEDQGSFAHFVYQPGEPGSQVIRASLQFESRPYEASWRLEVSDINSSDTPPVTIHRMHPGPNPGSIVLSWESPPASQVEVPLRQFRVYWSAQPIPPGSFDGTTEVVRPIDPGQLVQSLTLRNLPEEQPAYARIVVEDVLDRLSEPTEELSAPSTGHFDLSGVIRSIRVLNSVTPMASALVELDLEPRVTGADGSYSFLGLPSYPEWPGYTPPADPILRVSDASGVNFYGIVSQLPIVRETQHIELLMLPREIIQLNPTDPEDPSFAQLLPFLKFMTKNERNATVLDVPHWEDYPVTVYAPDKLLEGAREVVDYRAAFAAAVAGWNAAAGEELLRLADANAVADIGVTYSIDLPPSSPTLGETVMDLPAGGFLFRSIPEQIRIKLRAFSTQSLADKVVLHEMGHALGLWHSPSLDHVMEANVGASSDIVHRDEAFLARIIRHLPQRMDLNWYQDLGSGKLGEASVDGEGPRLCGTGP